MCKGENGKFSKNTVDTSIYTIRSIMWFPEMKHFTYDSLTKNDGTDNTTEMTDLVEENRRTVLPKHVAEITERMEEIETTYPALTYYVIIKLEYRELGAAFYYMAKLRGWVIIDLHPVNHPPLTSEPPEDQSEIFMSRCRHHIKFHHINRSKSENLVETESPNGMWDMKNAD